MQRGRIYRGTTSVHRTGIKYWYTVSKAVTGLPGHLTGICFRECHSGMNSDLIFCRLAPSPTLCEKSAVLLFSINDLWVYIYFTVLSIAQFFSLVKKNFSKNY